MRYRRTHTHVQLCSGSYVRHAKINKLIERNRHGYTSEAQRIIDQKTVRQVTVII